MLRIKSSSLIFGIVLTGMILVCFQNCSQTHFSTDPSSAVFKTAAVTSGGDDPTVGFGPAPSPSPGDQVGDNPQPSPSPSNQVGDNPLPSPSPGSNVGDNPAASPSPNGHVGDNPPSSPTPGSNVGDNPPSNSGPGSNGKGNSPQVDDPVANLVECEMISPSTKVILDFDLVVDHSNSSATRVCMSSNACLNIINAYAAQHDCSLSLGAATSSSQSQCTKIFPGSKGTCHNAAVVSDDQVNSILQNMSAK